MHPVGQASAQFPQSVQAFASITYGEPSLIAPTGHSLRQLPQPAQSSEIECAISFSLCGLQ
jgi:hypothetical protein